MWVYLNDRFVDRKEAMVSVFDHGFLYGDGIYETLRAYGGRIFMLRRHLARLRRSGELIGLDLPIPEADWPGLLKEAMQRNGLTDAYLRITISRGEGEIGLDPHLCPRPTVVIMAKPPMTYPAKLYAEGVDLAIVSVRRNLSLALPPRIKSLNFLNNILAKQEAARKQAFDGLMLNADGYLTECTASNVFFIRRGQLCTPSIECGILDGITRDVILQLARENHIPVEEGCYRTDPLLEADECFLSNTSMELMPVRTVDRLPIGPGKPGAYTHRLRDLFHTNLARFLEA
jgi:branched-chain amino acid aminotransferase